MATKIETQINELKINYLTEAQYEEALANNEINENEIYMTPENNVLSEYDLILSLNEWENLTKDHCEVISGSFSSVYEKYENGILPRVLLRRDFVYNSDCAVEYYESNSIKIGFNSNKYVDIMFDIAASSYVKTKETINIWSNGSDVDNNIITKLEYVREKNIYTTEIEFEMPYGSCPNEMTIEHFTYNSDDIANIYNTLVYNSDSDSVKVLLKGLYYIYSGSPYYTNIEPINVYINQSYYSNNKTNSSVFISFIAKVDNYSDVTYTLRFDRDTNGVFTLAHVDNDYKGSLDPFFITFTNSLSNKITVTYDESKYYPSLNMVFVNISFKVTKALSSGDVYIPITGSGIAFSSPSGFAPATLTALACSGTNANSKGIQAFAIQLSGVGFITDESIEVDNVFNISGWYEVSSS